MNNEQIVNKVKDTIKKYNLIKRDERIIAAVSGGPDSICMLHILNVLKSQLGFRLAVATFNHKIRKESDEEVEFVKNISAKLGIPFFYGEKNVKEIAEKKPRSLEDVAREERLKFLLKIKKEKKYDKIALAHTLDDLVETSLMHLLRGTGVTGLVGIKPLSFQGIIHPLLFIKREDVEAYLKSNNIPFRIDWTNFSLSYLRNRIRHQLVPLLTSLNPKIKQHILNLSIVLSEEDNFLNEIAKKDKEIIQNRGKYSVTMFNNLPLLEKRRIVKLILGEIASLRTQCTFKRIERVIDFLASNKQKANLYNNFYIRKNKTEFWIEQAASLPFTTEKEYVLNVQGETEIKEANITIKAEIVNSVDRATLGKNKVAIDMERVPRPLKVRFRRKGDRISIETGSKKIQDLFVNNKIDVEMRRRIPIIIDNKDEIIWVVGVRRSSLYKIENSTKKILLLTATLRKRFL